MLLPLDDVRNWHSIVRKLEGTVENHTVADVGGDFLRLDHAARRTAVALWLVLLMRREARDEQEQR